MKALSIRQPWAWLIVSRHKPIENRTWATKRRGPTMIHAAKGMTRDEYYAVAAYLKHEIGTGITLPPREQLERGGIVGIANIVDCVPPGHRSSPWHMENYHGFALADAKPSPFVPCKGALGFFDVPPEVAAQIGEIGASQASEGDAL